LTDRPPPGHLFRLLAGWIGAMKDDQGNIVRFRPRPKAPPPPPEPKRPPRSRPTGEPPINWSRAPRAVVIILIVLLVMWLIGGFAGWISGIGVR